MRAGLLVLLLAFTSAAGAKDAPATLVKHVDDAPVYEIAKGKATVTMLTDAKAYMGILAGKPGLVVPEHQHAGETEMLYVMEGGGWMTIAGKRQKVLAGMAIQVPPGVKHSFEIPADWKGKDFRAVQVYTKTGPQLRFKKGKLIKGGK